MTKPHLEWKVLPHGPLTAIDEGLWAVVGEIPMPLMDLPRRMTVVRLRDGGLVIWSAIALDEANMERLETLGRPTFLIVPGEHHRLDAASWKFRYPALQVVSAPGARAKIGDVVPVDSSAPDFGDPDVLFCAVPGTGDEEAALLVHRPDGSTLILNDLIGNIRDAEGFGGWVLRKMGLAGDAAQVPKATELLIVEDKKALAAQMNRWAALPDLRRIIVSHGEIIEAEPAAVLRRLAAALA